MYKNYNWCTLTFPGQ